MAPHSQPRPRLGGKEPESESKVESALHAEWSATLAKISAETKDPLRRLRVLHNDMNCT
jgi:hypothetical protein